MISNGDTLEGSSHDLFQSTVLASHCLLGCETLYCVVGYQHFGGPCCLHFQVENAVSMSLQNIGILPQHYTVSQPRRL